MSFCSDLGKSRRLVALLLAAACLAAEPVWAGGGADISGGGGAVVCFKTQESLAQVLANGGKLSEALLSEIASIEVLDLYEARLRRGVETTFVPKIIELTDEEAGSSADRVSAYIDLIIRRAESAVPELGALVRRSMSKVSAEDLEIEPVELSPVTDAAQIGILDPRRCALVKMAENTLEKDGAPARILIDSRLYEHPAHSDLSRAILKLHEYIYMEAERAGQTSSRNTRLLIGMLITENNGLTMNRLVSEARSLGFSGNRPFYTGPIWRGIGLLRSFLNEALRIDQELRAFADPRIEALNQELGSVGVTCWAYTVARCLRVAADYLPSLNSKSANKLWNELFVALGRRNRAIEGVFHQIFPEDSGAEAGVDAIEYGIVRSIGLKYLDHELAETLMGQGSDVERMLIALRGTLRGYLMTDVGKHIPVRYDATIARDGALDLYANGTEEAL